MVSAEEKARRKVLLARKEKQAVLKERLRKQKIYREAERTLGKQRRPLAKLAASEKKIAAGNKTETKNTKFLSRLCGGKLNLKKINF